MRVEVTSILVDDQKKAHEFYTDVLGFETKRDIPVGGASWLTVVAPDRADGVELLLEPDGNPAVSINGEPAAQVWKKTLYNAGMPYTLLFTDDIAEEYEELTAKGVEFRGKPAQTMGGIMAIFDDTCGNLIGLMQVVES